MPSVYRYGCLALSRLAAGNVLYKYGKRSPNLCIVVLSFTVNNILIDNRYFETVSELFFFFCFFIDRYRIELESLMTTIARNHRENDDLRTYARIVMDAVLGT